MSSPSNNKSRRKRKRAYRAVRVVLLVNALLTVLLVILIGMCVRQLTKVGASKDVTLASKTIEETEAETESSDLDELSWVLANASLFPDGKADDARENPGLSHFLYQYGTGSYDRYLAAELTEEEQNGGIPAFYQWDDRWGFAEYGSSVLGLTGCGPTSLSMLVVGLAGEKDVLPDTVARFAGENGYYLAGTGTKWSLMTDGAEAFGLLARELGSDPVLIYEALSRNEPVIVSVGQGHFTDTGHFLVLVGLSNGKVILHDPNSRENTERLWDFSEFQNEIRAAWAYQRRD